MSLQASRNEVILACVCGQKGISLRWSHQRSPNWVSIMALWRSGLPWMTWNESCKDIMKTFRLVLFDVIHGAECLFNLSLDKYRPRNGITEEIITKSLFRRSWLMNNYQQKEKCVYKQVLYHYEHHQSDPCQIPKGSTDLLSTLRMRLGKQWTIMQWWVEQRGYLYWRVVERVAFTPKAGY